jgi:hypothetical protein
VGLTVCVSSPLGNFPGPFSGSAAAAAWQHPAHADAPAGIGGPEVSLLGLGCMGMSDL